MNIINIPFSGGGLGHGNGANKAPLIIQNLLQDMFADEDGKETAFTFTTLDLDEHHIENSHNKIEAHVSAIDKPALLVGGDHSITYPAVKGFSKNNKAFKFICFDAHPDLVHNFVPPTQEDYLKVLIEEKIVDPKNIILIGLRNWDKIEVDYLKEKQIQYYTMKEVFSLGIKDIMKKVVSTCDLPIYLSLDIDVVDPVEAIGTGYTEHGGMSSRELLYAIQILKQHAKIVMADIVEVNPDKDVNNMTATLAAKIITELANIIT